MAARLAPPGRASGRSLRPGRRSRPRHRLARSRCWRRRWPDATPASSSAIGIYVAGLLAMLGSSLAYHAAAGSPHRPMLRQLDHAAIFAMIAGTATPFALARRDTFWGTAVARRSGPPRRSGSSPSCGRRSAASGGRRSPICCSAGSARSRSYRRSRPGLHYGSPPAASFIRSGSGFICGAACRFTARSGTAWSWPAPPAISSRSLTASSLHETDACSRPRPISRTQVAAAPPARGSPPAMAPAAAHRGQVAPRTGRGRRTRRRCADRTCDADSGSRSCRDRQSGLDQIRLA